VPFFLVFDPLMLEREDLHISTGQAQALLRRITPRVDRVDVT
jgi:hypothetical protein